MVKPENNKRISKVDAYLNCAENFAYRSTCIKRLFPQATTGRPEGLKTAAISGNVRAFRKICTREKDMQSAVPYMQRRMHF